MRAEDKLRAYWSKKENDLMLHWPAGVSTNCDGSYLSCVFSKEVRDELERRGYDLTTLKFSIEPVKGNKRFTSQSGEVADA